MPEQTMAANAGTPISGAPATPATSSIIGMATTDAPAHEGSLPVQSMPGELPDEGLTTTQAFARRLAQETAKVKDSTIAELGLTDPVTGELIATYEAYQKARGASQRQENQQAGINALQLLYTHLKSADPDVQALRQAQVQALTDGQVGALRRDFPELPVDESRDDLGLPNAEEIGWYIKNGMSLPDAYRLANFDALQQTAAVTAQQSAVSQILRNGESTPGSLASPPPDLSSSIWSMSAADFRRMQEKALAGELKK